MSAARKLTPPSASTSFSSTISGWQYLSLPRHHGSIRDEELLIQGRHPLLNKTLDLALNLNKNREELCVLIPGTFGGIDSFEMICIAKRMFDKGMSVLRMPNALSDAAVRAQPIYEPLQTEDEAKVWSEIVSQILSEYGFKKVNFAGSSYGALMVAIMASRFPQEKLGRVALFGPPKNVFASLKRIDSYIEPHRHELHLHTSLHLSIALKMKLAALKRSVFEMPDDHARSLLMLGGFQRDFCRLRLQLEDSRTGAIIPSSLRFHFSKQFREQQNAIRFQDHFLKSNPDALGNPARFEISHWLGKITKDWRIYSSNDDFINDDGSWQGTQSTMLFSDGGHVFGFMRNASFWRDLEAFFSKPK